MSLVNYKINLAGGGLMDMSVGINAQVLPLVSQAVRAVAQQAHADWVKAVHGAKLWSGEKDAYMQAITWRSTGDFSAVVEADYKYAQEIETGRPARDLKKMLDTSLKVRRTKDGRRFLVIPMRHNTSGNGALARPMSPAVQKMAKALAPSRVTGQGQRQSGEVVSLSPIYGMSKGRPNANFASNPSTKQAATVNSNTYAWGGRLKTGAIKADGLTPADAKRYAGMVKMNTTTPGGGKSSSYMTFRIMMEGSKGWILPSKPGLYLADGVAKALEPKARAAFGEAIKLSAKG